MNRCCETGEAQFGLSWARRSLLQLVVFVAIGAAMAVVGCDNENDDNSVGPCVHTHLDAVAHMESVRDRDSDALIDTVFVSAATVDGRSYALQWLAEEANAYGVQLVGDSLRCIIPSAFGTREGHWILAVSAPGYPEQTVEFDAHYAIFHGGCPSWNDDGTEVSLELIQEP